MKAGKASHQKIMALCLMVILVITRQITRLTALLLPPMQTHLPTAVPGLTTTCRLTLLRIAGIELREEEKLWKN